MYPTTSTRRFVMNERSVPKQSSNRTTSKKISNSNDIYYFQPSNIVATKHSRDQEWDEDKAIIKDDYMMSNNNIRRKNDINLKMQIQNLKEEMSKLVKKDSIGQRVTTENTYEPYYGGDKYSRNQSNAAESQGQMNNDDISDTMSTTSEKLINGPIRQLSKEAQNENYDHAHYLQLESQMLKNKLRNLKNKYNSMKKQLKEQCQDLEKKNNYLQIHLHRTQQQLAKCKSDLEQEISKIRFKLNRRQDIYSTDQKNQQQIPQNDTNDLLKNKMTKIYEELSNKDKKINMLGIDLKQSQLELNQKSFQLKKELQKNNQLFKQHEFTSRELVRNKTHLEKEINHNKELTLQLNRVKEKNQNIQLELYNHSQITQNSQEYESKSFMELHQKEKNIAILNGKVRELKDHNTKLVELNQSHEEQISYIKKSNTQFMGKIQQLSEKIKQIQEKMMEKEEEHRRIMSDKEKKYEEQIDILKEEYDEIKSNYIYEGDKKYNYEIQKKSTAVNDYQRQINKWKAQYKILKLKYQDKFKVESDKSDQINEYYRTSTEFKQQNQLLDAKNTLLEQTVGKYLKKLTEKEERCLKIDLEHKKLVNSKNQEIQQIKSIVEEKQTALKVLSDKSNDLELKIEANNEYNKQIQKKVYAFAENEQNFSQIIDKIKKRSVQQDDKIAKNIKQLKMKDTLIAKLKKEIRDLIENQQKEIVRIVEEKMQNASDEFLKTESSTIKDIKEFATHEVELHRQKYAKILDENAQFKRKIMEMQKEIENLRQQTKNISHLYNQKCQELQHCRDQLKKIKQKLELRQQAYKNERNNMTKNYESILKQRTAQIYHLRNEIQLALSYTNQKSHPNQNFDSLIKQHLQEIKKLRQTITSKNEQIYKIRDNYSSIRSENDNMKSQIQLIKLRNLSERKNLQVNYQVQIQNLKSNVLTEQKKCHSLIQKIQLIIQENKKKDSFIQTYIMGKKLPNQNTQFLKEFISKYEITMGSTSINEKLKSQSQELENMAAYNFSLIKEMANYKEKILLYQAIDGQKQSLYDSGCLEKFIKVAKSSNEENRQ